MEQLNAQYCQELLLQELATRKAKNSMYSLRAFARDLGIGSTSLSDAIASKRKLSKNNILKIAERLGLNQQQVNLLLAELKAHSLKKRPEEIERLQLEEDALKLISNWYYLAILNLAKIKDNRSDPNWIALRLGISKIDAEQAMERLHRMGLLELKNGKLVRTALKITSTRDVPSQALKKYHRENLKLAEQSLLMDSVDKREISSITMAIDPDKIPEAKEMILRAKREIAEVLESGNASEVYILSFQLFPLSK